MQSSSGVNFAAHRGLMYAGIGLFAASILLGGGTRAGFLSDAILQLLSIPVLIWASVTLRWGALPAGSRIALALAVAWFVIPLIQLIPLPISWWAHAGGRSPAMATLALVNNVPSTFPLSVAPSLTWQSALSFLPPMALLLVLVQLQRKERRNIAITFVVLAVASAFLGLVQLAQGPLSPLRFFEFTNVADAVGFFANRNHFSALAYAAVPVTLAMLVDNNPRHIPGSRHQSGLQAIAENASPTWIVAMSLSVFVLLAAQAMARSRAGLGLAIGSLAGAVAILALQTAQPTKNITTRMALGAIVVALVLGTQLATFRIAERFTMDPLSDARIPYSRNTWTAALEHLPFGSGFGSFPLVYPRFPSTADEFADIFANRAHNDIIEVLLEGGVLTALVGLAGVVAFVVCAWRLWAPSDRRPALVDLPLARAGTIIIILIVAHSFADYPLRTAAMGAVFMLAIGLLLPSGGAIASLGAAAAGARRDVVETPQAR